MMYQIPHFWNTAFNGIQFILFLMIFCYFLKNKMIHKKLEDSLSCKNINPKFEAAFVNITFQQSIYRAFTNILDTITAERNGLERILEYHADPRFDGEMKSSFLNTRKSINDAKQSGTDNNVESNIRKSDIRKFSSKGLNPRKISEALKIPLNEVELILNLDEN